MFTAEDILAEFEAGDLDPPGLLSWKRWQSWRADIGRRPAIRRGDAAGIVIGVESDTWKAVMEAVYGPDWYAKLRARNRDPAEAGGSDLASQLSGESAMLPLEGGQDGADLRD